jgi:Cu/Ag efflux protein CusF
MRTAIRLIACLALLIAFAFGQQSKKPIHFAGRVESVDVSNKIVTVKHGNIPGYMDAMTMGYSIEEEATLKKLAPGDDIVAVVYAGEAQLHNVRVVGHAPKMKDPKKEGPK